MDYGYNELYVSEVDTSELKLTLSDMMQDDTVGRLKRIVARRIGAPETWSQLSLTFCGEEMNNDESSLRSYGIQSGDTIYRAFAIDPRLLPKEPEPENPPTYNDAVGDRKLKTVFFKALDERTYTLEDISLKGTVGDLRKKLAKEKYIDDEYMRFIYGSKQLDNGTALMDVGLQNECTIHIVVRFPGGGNMPAA
ncbi:MAG: hypothetical protein M1813_001251 [Trichoglossum hirsutum]|nr:MAG: hypothetical protein M1813_001251 [Trichoglossum hirsutum]